MLLLTVLLGYAFASSQPFAAIAAIVTVRACLSSLLVPIRSVYSTNLVPAELIKSASAVHSTVMNLSRIAGPAMAGFLLSVMNPSTVFYINSASFLFVAATLVGIKEVTAQVKSQAGNPAALTREAYDYIRETKLVRSLFVLSIVPMVFGFPYTTLMPVIVEQILHAGTLELGLLLSAAAAGSVAGSLVLSISDGGAALGRRLLISIVTFGVGIATLSLLSSFAAAAAVLVVVGYASQIYRTSNRTAFLVSVPDQLRGRIMSVAMMDRGFIPLGTVLVTLVIENAGARIGIAVMGITCIVAALAVITIDRSVVTLQDAAAAV